MAAECRKRAETIQGSKGMEQARFWRRLILAGTGAATLAAIVALPAGTLAQQKTIKLGFISTFSGPTAVIGNDMRNSFELALDKSGRKMGGLPVEVIYEDDAQK